MGKFVRAVQVDEVPGPLRREFRVKLWTEAHSQLGQDAGDRQLYEAGLLVFEKASHIRSSLRVTFSKDFRATTKLRAFAALVNYNMLMIAGQVQSAMAAVVGEQALRAPGVPVMMHDLAGIKLDMGGAKFSPDEMFQSMIDGVQIPIKRILEVGPDLAGNAQFGKLNLDDIRFDFSLGTLYAHIERLWDDCLWNAYKPTRKEKRVVFSSEDESWQVREVASRVRVNSLATEFAAHALSVQRSIGFQALIDSFGSVDVKSLSRDGRNQTLRMAPIAADSQEAGWLQTLKLYASEPYYTDLLREPQSLLSGATLDQLLTAWTVVSRASQLLKDEVHSRTVSKPDEPRTWLPGFAPILQIRALVQGVSVACGTSLARSRALVEFLVYRGSPDDELWAQPLLPVSSEAVVPIFAATTSPNLRRLVDVWLKQLGVDMGLRGPAFEAYIRAQLGSDMANSPLLRGVSACLGHALKFTPTGGREEEIDVVAVVGDVVVIGEAKCFLEPAEPRETARHRDKVQEAVAQVRRKAVAVEAHKQEFRVRAGQVGLTLPEDFDVLPVVVLNSAFHCGVAVNGVPVVDEHILGVYFKGEFIEVALKAPQAGFSPIRKRVLYDSPNGGARGLRAFLSAPAQLEPLLAGISRRWVPVPPVNEADWSGMFLALDCAPKVDLSSVEEEFRRPLTHPQ